jgi:hypothetical protein
MRPAWWLQVYLFTLNALRHLLDCEPNMERVEYWLKKGMRFEFIPLTDHIDKAPGKRRTTGTSP